MSSFSAAANTGSLTEPGFLVGGMHRSWSPRVRQSSIFPDAGPTRRAVGQACRRGCRSLQKTAAVGSGSNQRVQEKLGSMSGVVTDENVPEGHQNLHGFLYGEGGAEEHEGTAYEFRRGEDDGSTILAVASYLDSRDGENPLGVYAVYDVDKNLQYVGFSRNIVLAVKGHMSRVGEDRCAFVRPMVFMNKAMATRTNLEREAQNWIDQVGTIPPGNGVEGHLWETKENSGQGSKTMSQKELEVYEEKKLKLRKAMGENLHDAVAGETQDAKERRLKMIKAVEGDDWSAVIDEQTQETVGQSAGAPVQEPIISPFTRAQVHRSIGNTKETAELTPKNVDAALDEVRPYLISDGGNVEVVGVENGTVLLRLQGACGTCPSSTATMKMGIERALMAAFGDKLKEVLQVDQQDTSASVTNVDEHLNLLRPAIEGYGGKVEVLKVEDGICELRFSGPAPISKGIQAAVKDKFPDIKEISFVD